MFYKLNNQYVLRGWIKMAWVLVNYETLEKRYLTYNEFQVLLLCDGETQVENMLNGTMKQVLKKFVSDNIVVLCYEKDPILKIQYYKYYKNRFVPSVMWSITGRCNYRCRHCYMDAPNDKYGELSTKQALQIIDQLAECGIQSVDLTGGEPFIRKDFWQLIDRMHQYNIQIEQVYTNGWLLNKHTIAEFKKRHIFPEFVFSYDGYGWHDWMRRIEGAEKAVIDAIKLCREHGFRVAVQMCIHKGNRDSLEKSIEYLTEIGVEYIRVGNIVETELWKQNADGMEYSDHDYYEDVISLIPVFYKKGMPVDIMFGSVIELQKHSVKYRILPEKYNGCKACMDKHLCGSVRWNVYITPEGRLLPCMPMTACDVQEDFPLIQDIGLANGLSDSYFMQFVDSRLRDLVERNSECASCEYVLRCGGGCRAIALMQPEHDIWGTDRSECLLWKGGYVDRIRSVADAAIKEYVSYDKIAEESE